EHHTRVAQRRRHFQRIGRRVEVRNREGGAIRKHTRGALDGEFADRKQIAIELELFKAPGRGMQRGSATLDVALEITLLLLEVLRPQELPLGPDDLVAIRHAYFPTGGVAAGAAGAAGRVGAAGAVGAVGDEKSGRESFGSENLCPASLGAAPLGGG